MEQDTGDEAGAVDALMESAAYVLTHLDVYTLFDGSSWCT